MSNPEQILQIKQGLALLGASVEALSNQPVPEPHIPDRGLSGNKVNGGRITNFQSNGIKDTSSDFVLTVNDGGIAVKAVHTPSIPNALSVGGDLTVDGAINARTLHVDEITSDVRNTRTSSLELSTDTGATAFGKGIIWTGGEYTRQLVLRQTGDDINLWTSENIDVPAGKSYRINNTEVINETGLGPSIVTSNIRRVGTLQNLNVEGFVNFDSYIFYDANTQRLGIGADDPNGALSIRSMDHEFMIDPTEDRGFKLGTWSTSKLEIITDDTARITIADTGKVTISGKTTFERPIGIGINNFQDDASITASGPIRFEGKKMTVGDAMPNNGTYAKGDIIWNSNPTASGHVGWVCIRAGSPGDWKPFGQIAG